MTNLSQTNLKEENANRYPLTGEKMMIKTHAEDSKRPLNDVKENKKRPMNDVQAAEHLGISVYTMRNWRNPPMRGPAFCKVGGRVVYFEKDLDRYLQLKRVDPEG